MEKQEFYNTVEKEGCAEFKDRGSRFIGYVIGVRNTDEFKERLNAIKKEHPKATHHCFAYRIGTDGSQFRVSDAGEPSGTAGRPILGQIDASQLINVMVIVVRYFGGTLLGTTGLINAYKSAASMAIQMTPVVRKPIEQEFVLHFDYTMLNDVMTIVKQYGVRIVQQEIQLFCRMQIAVPLSRLAEIQYKFNDLHQVELSKEDK